MSRRSRCADYSRPFIAPSLVRREPSVWVSGSGPSMPRRTPGSALLCRIQPLCRTSHAIVMQAHLRAGQDVNFCDSYAPLPSCRVSQFLAASFARNRRSRDFLKFGTFDGCASGMRVGEYSKSARNTLYR